MRVEVTHTTGVVPITPQFGLASLPLARSPMFRRSQTPSAGATPPRPASAAAGAYLAALRSQIAKAAGRPIVVPSYQVSAVSIHLQLAVGQAPPTVVATLTGMLTPLTYPVASRIPQSGTEARSRTPSTSRSPAAIF